MYFIVEAFCIIKNVNIENTSEYNKAMDWQAVKNFIGACETFSVK